MTANAKIEVFLLEGEKETRLESKRGKQVRKEGVITADDLKALMPVDLFDSKVYTKVKDEVWGSSLHAPLAGNTEVHWMQNLTYTVYVTKK